METYLTILEEDKLNPIVEAGIARKVATVSKKQTIVLKVSKVIGHWHPSVTDDARVARCCRASTTATQQDGADDDEAFVGSPVGSLTGHCSGVGGYE